MTRSLTVALLGAALLTASPLRAGAPVDINTANAEELDSLPGIGPAKARAILAYRSAHGQFGSVDELQEVKGIGPATLARLRPLVTIGGGAPAYDAPAQDDPSYDAPDGRAPPPDDDGYDLDLAAADTGRSEPARARPRPDTPAPSGAADDPRGRINVNTADEDALRSLPGIGPAKARAILARRRAGGPFRSVEQLTEVPGIGEKTVARLRPRVTVRLDLNAADLQALECIGLDTASAERLLAWRRKHGAFLNVAELTRVPGFGAGALETLRPFLWVAPPRDGR